MDLIFKQPVADPVTGKWRMTYFTKFRNDRDYMSEAKANAKVARGEASFYAVRVPARRKPVTTI